MSATEFLKKFDKNLRRLGVETGERRQAVAYYIEMIDDMVSDGMTEQDAVAALGDPAEAAGNFVSEMGSEFAKKPRSSGKALRTAAIIIGSPLWIVAIVVLAVIMLAVYICIWSGVAGLWCGVAGFAAGLIGGIGGAAIALMVPGGAVAAIWLAGCGIVCAGIGILWLIGMIKLTKVCARFTGWSFKTIFKRRRTR